MSMLNEGQGINKNKLAQTDGFQYNDGDNGVDRKRWGQLIGQLGDTFSKQPEIEKLDLKPPTPQSDIPGYTPPDTMQRLNALYKLMEQ